MEKSTKRKIAVAGSVLGLVCGAAGVLAGVSDDRGTSQSAGQSAAAPAGAVRAQQAADSTNPTRQDTPNGPHYTGNFTIKVKNFGAFVGGACILDVPGQLGSALLDVPHHDECSGDILVGQTFTKTVPFNNINRFAVNGFVRDGRLGNDIINKTESPDLKDGQDTYCFRFDGTDGGGTDLIPGFSFKAVDCSNIA